MVRQSTQAAAGGSDENRRSRPLDESSDVAATPPTAAVQGEDAEQPVATSSAASKKRKLGAASGRGVANLTPEQLAKKRANDREAQRAIRERTKNQIQALERRIEELTGLQPYRELQAAIEAKAAVERENAEMRQRLATIVGMLQPLIGQLPQGAATTTAAAAAAAAEQQPTSSNAQETAEQDSRRTHSPPPAKQTTTAGSTPTNGHHHHNHHYDDQDAAAQRLSDLDQQREQLRHGLDMGPERLGLSFLLDAGHQVSRIQGGGSGGAAESDNSTGYRYPVFHQRAPSSVAGSGSASPGPSIASSCVSRLPPPPLPQWRPGAVSAYNNNNAFPSAYPYQGPHGAADDDAEDADYADEAASNADEPIDTGGGSTVPRYAAPVRTTSPTCPLDALLLDFLHERRQRTAEGRPAHEVLGPRYPSVSSLLNPSRSAAAHPLSRVFTDILASFPAICGLPERVAVLYVMFLLMRWQVAPTRAHYERLPPWARPLRAQLRGPPHPAWIDHLPFPRMRAVLVRDHAKYPFDEFSAAYTTTLTLSWPYRDTDTLLQSPHSEELMINPVFERHLRNLENWKLGGAFARAFPGLADTGNVPEEELAEVRAGRGSPGV